jgi:hypothetical protein
VELKKKVKNKPKRDHWFIIDNEVKHYGLAQYIYFLPFSTQNNCLASGVKLSFSMDLKVICKLIGDNLVGLLLFCT